MDRRLRFFIPWLAALSPVMAGERLVVDGYARSVDGGILLGLSPSNSRGFWLASAPGDRFFAPPSRVRWEIEATGGRSAGGQPVARALGSAPKDFVWPSGEEFSPSKFAGAVTSMNPFENPLDPLGVRTGAPPDFDQDGISDEEDAFPDDPSESMDTDADGTGNNADPDDDNDGLPDTWEVAYGLDPFAANSTGDTDGDGFSNLAEYEAGTAPNDGGSRFHVKSMSLVSPGMLRLEWDAAPGRTYSLWHLPDLSPGAVMVESGIQAGAGGVIRRELPMSSPRDFYFLKATVTPDP